MERDFMGLNVKGDRIVVKEEEVEFFKDTESARGSGVPWPSSNKVSALPHFMSFKAAQDEKLQKVVPDHHLRSSGFMAMSSADAYDLNNKRQSSEFQPMHSSHPPLNAKMLPYSLGNPFFKTHFGGTGQSFPGATMKQPFIGGIPVTPPHSMLTSSAFVAGTTDPRLNSKAAGAPVQLTIFYAGTVNVYDDISPEKAQAIMFLAGNSICNNAPPTLAAGNGVFMNKTLNTPPCSAPSSSISVSSHPIGQTGVISIDNDETNVSKAIGVSNTLLSRLETPKIMTSFAPILPSTIVPSAVPQARKASLARFLEKRKERVMNSSPYHHSKISLEKTDSESNHADFSATSGADFRSMFARKGTGYNL